MNVCGSCQVEICWYTTQSAPADIQSQVTGRPHGCLHAFVLVCVPPLAVFRSVSGDQCVL